MYKSFRKQVIKCEKNGNLFEERCFCGQILLMCKKHGGQCISSKCLKERVDKKTWEEYLKEKDPIIKKYKTNI